jgi:hypothetical protein
MIAPPSALRLVTRIQGPPPRNPPFRLRTWTADAAAVAVWLEVSDDVTEALVAAQLPAPSALAPATPLFVLGSGMRTRSAAGWRSWLRRGTVAVDRSTRCGALLMRGYVRLGAAVDEASGADLVWGFSSLC